MQGNRKQEYEKSFVKFYMIFFVLFSCSEQVIWEEVGPVRNQNLRPRPKTNRS